MLLSNIFDNLTFGELGSLYMGGLDDDGQIERKFFPQIINHINSGLDALYARFPIKTDQVVIKQYSHIERYILDSRFAQTNKNSNEPIKYIDDSEYEPFNDKVFLIEKVIDEGGEELFVNDEDHYWSVHIPAPNIVQIPFAEDENSCVVIYRSGLPRIYAHNPEDGKIIQPEKYYIDLPPAFLNILCLYIAGRQFGTLNDDQEGATNMYFQKYRAAAAEIEKQGLYNKNGRINMKLDNAGWV